MPKIRKWLKKRRYQPTFAIEKVAASANPTRATAQFDVVSEQHLVPYDENLLERSRTQWQFGDWESLAKLERDTMQHHPDRAKLALLAAAGHLQQGNSQAARQFTRLAQSWGCSTKLISQILISGVHNSLGRAAAVSGQAQRALQHFQSSIQAGAANSEVRLLTEARVNRQLSQLCLPPDTLGRTAAIIGDEIRMDRHFRAAIVGSNSPSDRASLDRRQLELHRLDREKIATHPHVPKIEDEPTTYPPYGITSYAQNFEDVMLWRALWDVENGFYIDVGAWDPVIDSVSKAFHEHGWRGVHVEPLAEYAEKLRQDRPEDRVIQALVSQDVGEALLHAIPLTGLSTTADRYARNANQAGWPVEDRVLPCVTLAQVFSEIGEPEIHWLKIDVEGMESDVLGGWRTHQTRPWVVVVEATEPLSSVPSWSEWESQLFSRDYRFVYFDGLNRFYLYKDKTNLINRFSVAPNVFDNYVKFIPESRPDSRIPNSL